MEARSKIHRKKNVRVRVDDGVVDFAAIPDVPKSDEDRKFLSEALNHQWLFQSMDTEALGMVISKMTKRDYEQGDNIVTQVSEHADPFKSEKQLEPVLLLFLLRFFLPDTSILIISFLFLSLPFSSPFSSPFSPTLAPFQG